MGGGQASQGCPALSRTQASPLPVQGVERTAGAGVGVGMMGLHPMESTGHGQSHPGQALGSSHLGSDSEPVCHGLSLGAQVSVGPLANGEEDGIGLARGQARPAAPHRVSGRAAPSSPARPCASGRSGRGPPDGSAGSGGTRSCLCSHGIVVPRGPGPGGSMSGTLGRRGWGWRQGGCREPASLQPPATQHFSKLPLFPVSETPAVARSA